MYSYKQKHEIKAKAAEFFFFIWQFLGLNAHLATTNFFVNFVNN